MDNTKATDNLKPIRFAGELLPQWAQLLDLAARLCPLPEETRHWFARFTAHSGVDDARMVAEHCGLLRGGIETNREAILIGLRRQYNDPQPAQILAAWNYALDTMIAEAATRVTCPWKVEGADEGFYGDSDDGEVTLRRV